MLKRRAVRAAQAVFLALIVAWVSFGPVLQSSNHPKPPTGAVRHDEHPAEKIDWHNWTRDPIAVFTALLTAFNGLLFASTVALWVATRKTAQISERALTELERARIFVDGISDNLQQFIGSGALRREGLEPLGVPAFTLSLINFGRTPGNIEFASIMFQVLDRIPPPMTRLHLVVPNPNAESVEIIIGPDKRYTFPSMQCDPRFTAAHADAVRTGAAHVYCHGMVTYFDIFMNRHTIKFCRKYDPQRREWPPEGGRERNSSD